MRPAKTLKSLESLLKKPSFTAKEAREVGVHPATLSHHLKMRRIERLRHGVYKGVDAKGSNSIQWADLVDAVNSIPKGVVCLTSALALYGLTEEIPRQHWIAVRHDTTISAPRPIKIVRYRDMSLGLTKMKVEGTTIPIFDRERTILDAFRQLGKETAIKALKAGLSKKSSEKIDLTKLQQYAKKMRVSIKPYLLAMTT